MHAVRACFVAFMGIGTSVLSLNPSCLLHRGTRPKTPHHHPGFYSGASVLRRRVVNQSPSHGNRYPILLYATDDNEKSKPLTTLEPNLEGHSIASLKKQAQLFRDIAIPFFEEEESARWLLAGVVGLTLLNSGVSVAFSYIGRDFWTALSNKDPEQFSIMLSRFMGALAAGVPVTVFYRYQRESLAVAWREWLTARVMAIYYSGQTYYALEASKEIDNPDQRIAEDVRAFTRVSLEFLIALLTAAIDLVSFSTILYNIYPQLFAAIFLYAGAGTAGASALGRSLVGLNFYQLQREADFRYSLVRVRENAESIAFYGGERLELREIGRRFMRLIDNSKDIIKTQRNLEFFTVGYRYLIQVLPGFVVAPLYFQGKIELGVVSQSYGAFNHILSDLSLIVNQFEGLSQFSAGVDRLGEFLERMQGTAAVVSLAVAARNGATTDATAEAGATVRTALLKLPPGALVLQSEADPYGAASDVVMAGASSGVGLNGHSLADGHHVVGATPVVTAIAAVGGGEAGVMTLDGAGTREQGVPGVDFIAVGMVAGALLRLEDVTVTTPGVNGGRVLLRDVSFELGRGERLLIVGESGTGKSSLLRALAGLWSSGSGRVTRPPTEEMFFLPQRPYCTLGPLRDQITYPQKPGGARNGEGGGGGGGDASDAELLALLEQVDLGSLPRLMGKGDPLRGLSEVRDWSDMLSLGEQQRLAFARLLHNCPRLVVLDEATSALDLRNEKRMYGLLRAVPGLSVVSVGHRPSLARFHTHRLRLRAGAAGYQLDPIAPSTAAAAEADPDTWPSFK